MTDEEIRQMEDLDGEVARLKSKLSSVEMALSYAEHDKAYYRDECARLRRLLYREPVTPANVPF